MRAFLTKWSVSLAAVFALVAVHHVPVAHAAAAAAAAPNPYEKEILEYEAADKKAMPPAGGVVFLGSSSFKTWNLDENFPNKGYINRGFGGSQMSDALHYVDRIVINYKPRTVVVYEGDNDVEAGVTAEKIASDFDKFVRAVHAKLPQTRIVFLSIKPSVARWAVVDRMRAANAVLKQYIDRNDGIAYVDADQVFMGWDKKPRPELYDPKGKLHPSAEGKKIWAFLLAPYLEDSPMKTASK